MKTKKGLIVFLFSVIFLVGFLGSVNAVVTSVNVDYPTQSGLVLKDEINIQWSITTDSGGETPATSYDIAYSLDNGINWVNIEQGVARGERNYLWTTTSFYDTKNARIRVKEFSTNKYDISDNKFEIDNIGPNKINDLSATSVQNGEIKLEWTATGDDDGVGTASSYIIKYSTFDITSEEEFESATTYSQSWVPKTSEQAENYDLNGFNDGVTYYFAIKAVDNADNKGIISNSDSAISDGTIPTAEFISFIPEEGLTNQSSVTFTTSCTDSGSGIADSNGCIVEVRYNNGTYETKTSPYTMSNDGVYDFKLTATDKAGNINIIVKQITRDTIAPSISILNNFDKNWYVGSSVNVLTECNDDNAQIKYYYSDEEIDDCSDINYESYGGNSSADKPYVCAAAKDNAGNIRFSDMVTFNIASTIQGAITAASAGDTINVGAGVYDEQLIIDKQLTLDGSGLATIQPSANPIIAVDDIKIIGSGTIIKNFILDFNGADDTRGYGITGFTGIVISGLDGPSVTNVQILNNIIYTANNIEDTNDASIETGKNAAVGGLLIQGNVFYAGNAISPGEGIYINPRTDATLITINNNEFYGNLYSGISSESGNVEVTDNTINSNLAKGTYGIRFFDLTSLATLNNIVVSGNNVQNVQKGIRVGNGGAGTSSITTSITSNILTNNDIGIWARQYGAVITANYNKLSGNTKGIQNDDGTTTISAENNWWGFTTDSQISNLISGNVDYTPWAYDSDLHTDSANPTIGLITISPKSESYISGTSTISATVTDSLSGINSCEYTLNGGDNWIAGTINSGSCTLTGINTASANSINIRATDKSGNIGTGIAIAIIPDTTSPTTTDSGTDANWHNTNVVVTLTPNDGAGSGIANTYYCIDQAGICTPNIEGTSVTVSTEGTNFIRYKSIDKVGNAETVKTASNTIKIDKTTPSVDAGTDKIAKTQISQDANVDGSASGVAAYAWTKVSGTGTITFGTANAEDTTISADTDGVYVIRLTVTDNAGNPATYDEMQLTWDITKPITNDNYGAKDDVWQQANQIITLTPDDVTSGIASTKYCVDTSNACNPATDYTTEITISDEGTNYFRYQSTDLAGNIQDIVSRIVKIDKNAPIISQINPGDKIISAGNSVIINATIDDLGSGIKNNEVILHYNDGTDKTIIMTNTGSLYNATIISSAKGTITYYITAKDNVNNEKREPATDYTITVHDLVWTLDDSAISGWNLVSTPKTLTDPDKTNLVGNDAIVYEYSNGNWLTNEEITTIEPGKGYWIDNNGKQEAGLNYNASGDCTPGPQCTPSTQDINIELITAGWNLIGLTTTNSTKKVSDAFKSPLTQQWVPGLFYVVSYDEGTNQFVFMNADNIVNPGEGYWVYKAQ